MQFVNEAASCSKERPNRPKSDCSDPPEDGLQSRVSSGLVFAKQAAAANVAGVRKASGDSKCSRRQQQVAVADRVAGEQGCDARSVHALCLLHRVAQSDK